MATIKDVAKLAGVSISTVSKVINKYELVSDATRTKVEAAINELNYVPNQMASSLSSKNKNRIALIVKINEHKQAIDEMNMQYIQGASKVAHELKIDFVTIFSTEIDNLSINELIIHLKSLGINGIIIFGLSKDDETLHELVTKQLFKTIVIDADFLNPYTGALMVNHYQGQYDVINAVYQEQKFKNMLYIAGKENGYITILRTEAAKDFCFDQDIKITIKDGNFNEFLAYEIAKEDAYKYDAIICASDLMAIGVKRALKEQNLNIPIAGFDGISLMGYVADDILTVKQDFYEISQIAFQKIVNLVTGVEEPSLTFVPYEVTKINRDDLKY